MQASVATTLSQIKGTRARVSLSMVGVALLSVMLVGIYVMLMAPRVMKPSGDLPPSKKDVPYGYCCEDGTAVPMMTSKEMRACKGGSANSCFGTCGTYCKTINSETFGCSVRAAPLPSANTTKQNLLPPTGNTCSRMKGSWKPQKCEGRSSDSCWQRWTCDPVAGVDNAAYDPQDSGICASGASPWATTHDGASCWAIAAGPGTGSATVPDQVVANCEKLFWCDESNGDAYRVRSFYGKPGAAGVYANAAAAAANCKTPVAPTNTYYRWNATAGNCGTVTAATQPANTFSTYSACMQTACPAQTGPTVGGGDTGCVSGVDCTWCSSKPDHCLSADYLCCGGAAETGNLFSACYSCVNGDPLPKAGFNPNCEDCSITGSTVPMKFPSCNQMCAGSGEKDMTTFCESVGGTYVDAHQLSLTTSDAVPIAGSGYGACQAQNPGSSCECTGCVTHNAPACGNGAPGWGSSGQLFRGSACVGDSLCANYAGAGSWSAARLLADGKLTGTAKEDVLAALDSKQNLGYTEACRVFAVCGNAAANDFSDMVPGSAVAEKIAAMGAGYQWLKAGSTQEPPSTWNYDLTARIRANVASCSAMFAQGPDPDSSYNLNYTGWTPYWKAQPEPVQPPYKSPYVLAEVQYKSCAPAAQIGLGLPWDGATAPVPTVTGIGYRHEPKGLTATHFFGGRISAGTPPSGAAKANVCATASPGYASVAAAKAAMAGADSQNEFISAISLLNFSSEKVYVKTTSTSTGVLVCYETGGHAIGNASPVAPMVVPGAYGGSYQLLYADGTVFGKLENVTGVEAVAVGANFTAQPRALSCQKEIPALPFAIASSILLVGAVGARAMTNTVLSRQVFNATSKGQISVTGGAAQYDPSVDYVSAADGGYLVGGGYFAAAIACSLLAAVVFAFLFGIKKKWWFKGNTGCGECYLRNPAGPTRPEDGALAQVGDWVYSDPSADGESAGAATGSVVGRYLREATCRAFGALCDCRSAPMENNCTVFSAARGATMIPFAGNTEPVFASWNQAAANSPTANVYSSSCCYNMPDGSPPVCVNCSIEPEGQLYYCGVE